MSREIDEFLRTYTKAIEESTAAVFAGAGLSKPAGFVNWKELLRDIADEIGLDVDKETDLIGVAQYHVNENGGNRGRINQVLIEEFTKDTYVTENHKILAKLPIQTDVVLRFVILFMIHTQPHFPKSSGHSSIFIP
ncbi:hypothetical protein [Bacillus mycoides]|uniref:hypothetical protein n=1 Tax=Bacillus mycoides TaxID=1405 RepID=UPI0018E9C8BB|nr:hypothetical protein [Bacillus mycoides]MED1630396.1 hypothetical protein [Bacillus mycoides]HDR7646299.1 hypothetical protein [Bacillus mycoides]